MPQAPTTIFELPDFGSVQGTDRIPVDRLGAAVTAGAFVVDQAYQIVTVGSTNFAAIGAASNTVGVYFVATEAGSGNGTAAPINTGDAPLSAVAALLGGDPAGTATAAVAAHEAAADPHPTYSTASDVRATPITGYVSGAGTVAATDSLLEVIQKLDGNDRTVPTQTLTYAATINLDLATLTGTHQLLTLSGAVEFTASNLALGRWVTIFIDPGASNRTLTFQAAWVFYSTKPAAQTANKRAILALKANGTASSDIAAIWRESP